VALTVDEQDRYDSLSEEIARLVGRFDGQFDSDHLDGVAKMKFLERARLLGHGSGKIPALRDELSARAESWFQLVYCAEGYPPVPTEPNTTSEERQIDRVLRCVGRDLGLTANAYVSETSRTDRKRLLERFATGDDLRVLISMRCLDEGVDIPDARVAYILASSTNPRQFIQRRGRILRRSPEKTHAEIVDFMTIPSTNRTGSDDQKAGHQLLRRELARVSEFAKLADNGPQAMRSLLEVRKQHNLLGQ